MKFSVLAAVLVASAPAHAAIDIETLGFNEHTFRGVNMVPPHEEYYFKSEFNGRDMARSHWTGHAGEILNSNYTQDADGIVILETFPKRYREVEPFEETYIVFDGVPSSGPILRLTSSISGTKIKRLPRSYPGLRSNPNISTVPLPSTLPLLVFAMGGLGLMARKKRSKSN